MKKTLLFTFATAIAISSFAQARKGAATNLINSSIAKQMPTAAKTTGDGDTLTMINFASDQIDSLVNIGVVGDSGFVYGTNGYGDKAWAERFDFNPADSGLKVIGAIAIFEGTYTMGTTKTVTFYTWAQGPRTAHSNTTFPYDMTGVPTTTLASLANVSIANIGIDPTGGSDSFYTAIFTAPTASLTDSFFVGYGINYNFTSLNGDTIGILTTRDGYRYTPSYYANGTDTVINTQNASQFADGSWHEDRFDNFQLFNHLAIFPIVIVDYSAALAVHGVVKNNLEFFGNYPNPATNSTTVRFALSKADNITLSIMDMTGHVINTITKNGLGAGEHTIEVETSSLASGNYLYVIRTGSGDGMASQFSVVK